MWLGIQYFQILESETWYAYAVYQRLYTQWGLGLYLIIKHMNRSVLKGMNMQCKWGKDRSLLVATFKSGPQTLSPQSLLQQSFILCLLFFYFHWQLHSVYIVEDRSEGFGMGQSPIGWGLSPDSVVSYLFDLRQTSMLQLFYGDKNFCLPS